MRHKGDSGNDVACLQFLLRQRGGDVTADAVFDTQTRATVISFQQSRGLSADGIVGPATWTELVVTVAPGSAQSDAVRALRFQDRSAPSEAVPHLHPTGEPACASDPS